jgi:rhodanese-related sulfurtransferase
MEALFKTNRLPSNLVVMTIADTTPTAAEAVRHFAAKLQFETDPSDVKAALDAGERFVLVDSRGEAAWLQGRLPGALHLPTADIATRATALIPHGTPVVVYCWGPGCNGSTRASLEFSLLGYPVKEMIGGFEYWAREGLGIVDDGGVIDRTIDELTAPIGPGIIDCAC